MKKLFRYSLGVLALGAGCAKPAVTPEPAPAPAPAPAAASAPAAPGTGTPYAVFDTNRGKIVVKLFPDAAPKTVQNFIGLATGMKAWTDPRSGAQSNKPLYDGTVFHRVIPGFMIQGGDPLGRGTGGPGFQFEDEFGSGKTFDKTGILAMANSGPNTNGSQFFITLGPTPWLNNHHTIFGEVVEGQSVVEAIGAAPRGGADVPNEPQVINKLTIEYR
ncbi:MAG: peptidylprolyl isomerase [Elusimicrobia bacterium]|nr:peptidylprolyl isomerase [Elusimicrobiota bacterium]